MSGGHLLCPGGSQMETRRAAICNFLNVNSKLPRQQVGASSSLLTPYSLILSPLFLAILGLVLLCPDVSRCPRPLASVTSPGHLVKSSINSKKQDEVFSAPIVRVPKRLPRDSLKRLPRHPLFIISSREPSAQVASL